MDTDIPQETKIESPDQILDTPQTARIHITECLLCNFRAYLNSIASSYSYIVDDSEQDMKQSKFFINLEVGLSYKSGFTYIGEQLQEQKIYLNLH